MSEADKLYQYLLTYNKLRAAAEKQPDHNRFQYQMDFIREKLQAKLRERSIDATVPRFHYERGTYRPDRFVNRPNKPRWIPSAEEFKKHPMISKLGKHNEIPDEDDTNDETMLRRAGKYIPRSLKASHSSLSKTEVARANLLHASQVYNKSGEIGQAEMFLNQLESTKDYIIDRNLSTKDALVVTKSTGEVEVVFRGTDPKSLRDLYTDVNIGLGSEAGTQQFKDAETLVKDVFSKYGKIDHVSGFSLGGAKASKMGRLYDIKATLFNPWMGKNYINQGPTKETQTIIRTTEDIASANLLRSNSSDNFDIKSLYPIKGQGDPVSSHNLINFRKERVDTLPELLDGINNDVGLRGHIETVKANSRRVAEYTSLHRAKNSNSFSEFVRHHADGFENNKTTEINEQGDVIIKKGIITAKSKLLRDWTAVNGSLTRDEINNIEVEMRDIGKINKRSTNPLSKQQKIKRDIMSKIKPKPIPLYDNDPQRKLQEIRRQAEQLQDQVSDVAGKVKQLDEANITDNVNMRRSLIEKANDKHHRIRPRELSQQDMSEFLNKSATERNGVIDDSIQTTKNSVNEMNETINNLHPDDSKILASNAKKMFTGTTSLAGGILAGSAVNSIFENYVDKSHWMNREVRDVAEGGTTGAVTAAGLAAITSNPLTTAALLPEIVAGGVGYLTGDLASRGTTYLAEELGASEDVAEGIGSVSGGIVGGASAVAAGATVSALIAGAEIGSLLGPGGILVGAGVGAAIGLGSYLYEHFWDIF